MPGRVQLLIQHHLRVLPSLCNVAHSLISAWGAVMWSTPSAVLSAGAGSLWFAASVGAAPVSVRSHARVWPSWRTRVLTVAGAVPTPG